MASLFEQMPGMLGNVASNAAETTVRAARNVGSLHFSNWIIYALIIVILVLIYMMLRGQKLTFKMLDFRSPKSKALHDAHQFWQSGKGGISNLTVAEDLLPTNMNAMYTYHVDLLLANTRNLTNIEGPYRHIFHRGSDELFNPATGTAPTQLPPYGLPKRLNPGIFLDPNTNDILVFVDTKSKNGDVYRESARIVDVPVDKPLRITVSVHNQVLEVNLNCRLELTKVLAGEPKAVENELYGVCGRAAAEAAVQNLIVWPYAITSQSLNHFCPMPFPPFKAPSKTCGASTDPSLLASESISDIVDMATSMNPLV